MIQEKDYLEDLQADNFCILKVETYEEVRRICSNLGKIIHEQEVTPKLKSKSLSNSYKALDFHTDHHRAVIVGLFCIKQAIYGGNTRLIDSYEVLNYFSKKEIEILKSIYLYEHRIFENDSDKFPLLEGNNNEYKVYYSYWLAKNSLNEQQYELFNKFKEVTQTIPQIKLKLKPNELLLFYNRRILHSRTEIRIGEERLLKRIWIETNNQGE